MSLEMGLSDSVGVLAVLVAALSMLVTVLIGWQIYNIIYLGKTVRKIVRREIANEVDILRKEIAFSTGTSLFNISESMKELNVYNHSMTGYIKALCELYKENPNSEEVSLCFDRIDEVINLCASKKLVLPSYGLTKYLDMLDGIKDCRKVNIVKFLLRN